jgi:hypothetical protein
VNKDNPVDEAFICAYCFEENSIFVDPSGGSHQAYVEDCQVCCRPNRLFIEWDDDNSSFSVTSEPES